ncbi:MAG: hypothetical protein MJE68_26735, partial [Proteobacteria bacterium]|nr:hypothetical protein [Pseudomonadota bacterium]
LYANDIKNKLEQLNLYDMKHDNGIILNDMLGEKSYNELLKKRNVDEIYNVKNTSAIGDEEDGNIVRVYMKKGRQYPLVIIMLKTMVEAFMTSLVRVPMKRDFENTQGGKILIENNSYIQLLRKIALENQGETDVEDETNIEGLETFCRSLIIKQVCGLSMYHMKWVTRDVFENEINHDEDISAFNQFVLLHYILRVYYRISLPQLIDIYVETTNELFGDEFEFVFNKFFSQLL